MSVKPFPNYMELRRRLPVEAWPPVRLACVVVFLGLCVTLFVRPAGGLFFFWRVLVPLLPLTFLLAPGLWRNVCPLAAANQAPRVFGFTRGKAQPALLRNRGYVVAIVAFAGIVTTRKPLFDKNGAALAALLLFLITAAFVTGTRWKGKSGWCSSICPLLPVQRLYGQTPFVTVPNSHCQPCVGCTKNCYDFNPGAAYLADMHDPAPDWSASRRLFAGAFPGMVYGFSTVPATADMAHTYGHILLWSAIGAGIFFAADALLPLSSSQVSVLGGAAAANLYYWYQAPILADTWGRLLGSNMGWLGTLVRVSVPAITAVWVARTVRAEARFVEHAAASSVPVKLSATRVEKLGQDADGDGPEVTFKPDDHRVVTVPGATLLEVCERAGRPIEAGCRMGMCGADPIAVLEGLDRLTPVGGDEATTLHRLGLGDHVRLACSARVTGSVCVSLADDDLRRRAAQQAAPLGRVGTSPNDPSVRRVVVLGNGIAGVTAADFVRRHNPDCEIDLIGKEAHLLYNRMGISRLVYGRSAMQGLYLLPEHWYEENRITCWLNTRAQRIDREARRVLLATGEELPYDRLILAVGSSSFVPPITGYGRAGSFVLREADDAMAIRRYAQEHGSRRAVVAGGGLLGLEAAHALHQLGLAATVVERSSRLLTNYTDERASELLTEYLENLGIDIVRGASITSVEGEAGVSVVVLTDGRVLPCDVLLVAAGIQPNISLARDAGLDVNRGVIVDARMRTSDPDIYAAGDIAEIDGRVLGLWPIAVNQAEAAARNAVGADEAHAHVLPVALLKGVGIDLLSAGRITVDEAAGGEAIVVDSGREHQYAKLVLSADGRLVGGLLLNRSSDHSALVTAVKNALDVSALRPQLRAGDLAALAARLSEHALAPIGS